MALPRRGVKERARDIIVPGERSPERARTTRRRECERPRRGTAGYQIEIAVIVQIVEDHASKSAGRNRPTFKIRLRFPGWSNRLLGSTP